MMTTPIELGEAYSEGEEHGENMTLWELRCVDVALLDALLHARGVDDQDIAALCSADTPQSFETAIAHLREAKP